MDKRAIQILFNAYWSSSGWMSEDERDVAPEEFAYAKGAGVMFDPVSLSHTEVVQRAISVRGALTPEAVADGFLVSLSTKHLDHRSALGSYAVLRLFPRHGYSPKEKQCAVCGLYEQGRENVLGFERLKWGGVRHDQPLYTLFDLEQFLKSNRARPSASDVRLFRELLRIIEAVPPDTSAAMLSKHLASADFKSNKAERDVMIGILGLCGILGTAAHPGYVQRFVPYSERELPPRGFVDMHYPACWWRGSDGINREVLTLYFGHVL
jgi:hypothetical protein